jgi:hypothetical protein
LHALGRAAAIEVHLVIPEAFGNARRLGQLLWLAAAELQDNRMLCFIKADQSLAITMDQRIRRHHFRPQQRAFRQAPMKRPAMPVSPVHHGSHGETIV